MDSSSIADRFITSRQDLVRKDLQPPARQEAAEGGCGVVGLAASVPVAGRHLVAPARQMRNRGNGKGGGLAAAGLSPAQMRVSAETLRSATLLQIAYLDPAARPEVEQQALLPYYDLIQAYAVETLDDPRQVPDLVVRPPDVWRYFVRVRRDVLDRFAGRYGLEGVQPRQVEDEFVYRTSFRLNQAYYASLGEKRAFVLCHGRDLLVFKIVGYAEQAAAYYRLEDLRAHVWIAHQRYPTKGRVWHPGGAHPFVGLNEALVHNGDFANYHAVVTYLRQRNITPLFLTDTEVSVQLFDLLDRVYGYPLEATIEALAPTTERDYDLLPPEKQRSYRAIQAVHLQASPDGPWFFIIARSQPDLEQWQLLGITDTSMLRPQVFALHEGKVQIGLVASEKQAIDAALESLAAEDERICPVADRYWNARGGSHTDGGAFVFTVHSVHGSATAKQNVKTLEVTDKFGARVAAPADQVHNNPSTAQVAAAQLSWLASPAAQAGLAGRPSLPSEPEWVVAGLEGVEPAWGHLQAALRGWDYGTLTWFCQHLATLSTQAEEAWAFALELLTRLRDRAYDPGRMRRASVLALVDRALAQVLDSVALLDVPGASTRRRVNWQTRTTLRAPEGDEQALVVEVGAFPPDGEDSAARLITEAVGLGWRRLVAYGWHGGRFCGCGLSPAGQGVRIDVYGSSGDYLGSGLQGAELHVHGSAQDQVGQVLKSGRLVIHGDVGQTFMYGAKGGEAFVLGNAAGRPLINAAGNPRVIINGTCLDYLAESFMAGDPLDGGGFAIVNGIAFDAHGRMYAQPAPYPGSNLFSLASGGAIYIRDPGLLVVEEQLNGGVLVPLTQADWRVIQPYLVENERLLGVEVEALLTVDGERRPPEQVYRKVAPKRMVALN